MDALKPRRDIIQEKGEWLAACDDALTVANNYVFAVVTQISRVREECADAELFVMRQFVEFEFLLVALTRLRRAAGVINLFPYTESNLSQAMAKYDERLLGLKQWRNITEHYDDYLLNIGRDKKLDPKTIRSGYMTKCMSYDSVEWMGFKFELDECLAAAEELYISMKAARKLITLRGFTYD